MRVRQRDQGFIFLAFYVMGLFFLMHRYHGVWNLPAVVWTLTAFLGGAWTLWRRQLKKQGFLARRYRHSRKTAAPVKELHILFRSCTRHSIKAAPRPGNASKREVVLGSLQSLLNSITPVCTIHVLDDHSAPEDAAKMKDLLAKHSPRHQFVPLEQTGNGASLEANFRYALDHDFELVYFCEDDYVHLPEAIPAMLEFYAGFAYDCIIHPTDYIDRYVRDEPYPSLIFLGKDRHWRTIRHTTGTFMLSRRILQKYQKLYLGFAEHNKRKWGGEARTVNRVYQTELCLSPIPSLAAHYSSDPAMPPFVDWQGFFFNLLRESGIRS